MRLQKLALKNVRAYTHATAEIPEGVSVFFGPNGAGKTTFLEAASLLSTLRSFRTHQTCDLLRAGSEDALIRGDLADPDHQVSIELYSKKRALFKDGKKTTGPKFLVGFLSVALAPEHLHLLRGGGEERRRLLDRMLFGLDPAYLATAQKYQRALKHKQALLRAELPTSVYEDQVAPWNDELSRSGQLIRARRTELVTELAGEVKKRFSEIVTGGEGPELSYKCSEAGLSEELVQASARERASGRALVGPHRDDLEIRFLGEPAAKVASHGESASILLALKLAELSVLERKGLSQPTLLLDDVGATLDEERRDRLFQTLKAGKYQALISTADRGVLEAATAAGARALSRKNDHSGDGVFVAKWVVA